MNKFIVKNIDIKENKVIFDYEIVGKWKKYFNTKNIFFIQYNENIENVPKSICAIPLLTDILPMSWIFDAEIIIDEVDKEFYNSIEEFKNGFKNMYPMLEFKGKINVKKIVDNTYQVTEKVGQFFSGGVDAVSTLITHIEEKPLLINLQGSDVDVRDENAIKGVQENLKSIAENLNLEITFVKSSFKKLIRHRLIDLYIKPKAKDNYWHGFQHGIAIIGHAAPIAYIHKLKTIYIAASFTADQKVSCASDPTIDNFVKLSSTSIYHDGYNYDRGDKIRNIIQYDRNHDCKIKLRVCFDENKSDNCCKCEKCYRTIYEIIANNYEPNKLGFDYDDTIYERVKKEFEERIFLGHTKHWDRIQAKFKENEENIKNDERFSWILDYKFTTKIKLIKYVNKVYFAIMKRIKRLINKLFKRK